MVEYGFDFRHADNDPIDLLVESSQRLLALTHLRLKASMVVARVAVRLVVPPQEKSDQRHDDRAHNAERAVKSLVHSSTP